MSNLSGISLLLPIGTGYDQVPPRRPGLTDLQAELGQDDNENPPTAGMPCAGEANNIAATVAEHAKTNPIAKISVAIVAGAGQVSLFSAVGESHALTDLSIVRHSGGAAQGDFDITWPANSFPVPVAEPELSVNGTTPGFGSVSRIANGVRVVIVNGSNAATDLPFTVSIN